MPFIDAFPDTIPVLRTASLLNFILDIEPIEPGELKHFLWVPRLLVDGDEVRIRDVARVSEDENSLGETLTVTLVDDDDRALFTSTASIEFGIGRTIDGDWDETTFITLLTDAEVSGIGYDIQGAPQNMTDRSAITIISKTANRINKTSETGLIIYDSDRVTITDSDLKPVKDSNGNVYTPIAVAIPGLKLSDLFQRVFIVECGFDNYFTNLPADDYPLQRYQVKMGERFYDGLKGFIGMFTPAVTPVGDDIWITDTTIAQPDGFPDPKEITVDRPLGINTQQSRQDLDGLLVQYVGLENNYDFTTFRYEYPIDVKGRLRTESEIITIEFRKIVPTGSIIVREAINIENRRSFLSGTEVDNSSESTEFTSNGWPSHIRKTTQKRLPPISDPSLAPILQNALTEREEYIYNPHPFKRQTQYTSRRSFHSDGIIAHDADNPLPDGSEYLRDLTTAQRSGNVATGQTFVSGPIRTREETTEPLRNGNVRFREYEVDEMSDLVVVDRVGEKPGEIGMSGVSSTQQELLVLAPGVTARTADFVEDFPVGELPLRYAQPLAERVIVQRQADAGTVSIPVIGYDASLKKGVPIKVGDRDGNSLGNFLITGRTIDIDASGVIVNLSGRAIAGSDAPLQQIPVYSRTIADSEVLLFTIPVECTDGYTMRVLQGSVADVSIEARHGASGAYTNIETTELDLSPWDGTTQNFQIRITAGTVTEHTRVQFDVNVDVAI